MGYAVQDEENIELHSSLAAEILYDGREEVSQEFTEQLQSGKAVAKLILYKPHEAGEVAPLPELDKKETEPEENEDTGEDISTAQVDAMLEVAKIIYGCWPTEGDRYPLSVDPESLDARYRKGTDIPAIWTPLTPDGKANAIMKFFPKFAEKYKLPPQPTLPPVITIVFDAVKSLEVNEMMQNFQDEIITTGYFTGPDPSSAIKLATTQEQYEQHNKQDGETLVIVVSRRRSDPLLSFCQLGPIYISDNVDDGKKDYEAFFPEDEEEKEEFSPEKPQKTSKLEVTIPQYKGEDDEISEYTCEKGEMSVPHSNEVSGCLSSTIGQTPSSKVCGEQAPAQEAVNPEA
ncbi:hypothetical protein B7P43_G14117 [Cryptotermes secundus]|nr:hypothetical protein B7P43_G14117 [Cryptotermes secundus]